MVRKLIFSYDYFEILSESIKEIKSEEDRKLLLFQIKLEVEKSPFLLSTKEWERMRYENMSDYSKVVLQFICKRCTHVFPSIINIYSFLVLMFTFRLETENYHSKFLEYNISCPDCEKSDELVILPSWMESAELLLRRRIVETKNYSQ